jgi:hypothetical protein
MNGITLEDVATDLRRPMRIGPESDCDLILPDINLRLVAHRDRLVIPGYTTLGAGHSWSLGVNYLTVSITHLRPQEAQDFEAPIRNIGLLCMTAALLVFATFWEIATEFVSDEPEVAIAANALSAQLGIAAWLEAVKTTKEPAIRDDSPEYPAAIYREQPVAGSPTAGAASK